MPNVNTTYFGKFAYFLAKSSFRWHIPSSRQLIVPAPSRNTLKNKFLHRNLRKKIEIHSMSLIKYNVNSNSWNFFYNVSIINV